MSGKALFLDRDGVINVDKGYVYRVQDFTFIDGYFEFVRRACDLGFKVFVVTNQSGIGRGFYSEQDFLNISQWLIQITSQFGGLITAVYHCPHHPTEAMPRYLRDCDCRKPKPGMLFRASADYGLNLQQCVLIGDRPTDIKAGIAAGISTNVLFGEKNIRPELQGLQFARAKDFSACESFLQNI